MIYHTSKYELHKDGEVISFDSEKDACEYLNVKQCSVASCYRTNTLCKGYKVVKLGSSTHNDTKSRLFKIWSGMKERCYRINHKHYKDYGGRGIEICTEWKDDYLTFKQWALCNGYKENLTLDRINVNGNYEPQNCRWTTVKEQMNNKRNNHLIEIEGEMLTISQISEKYNIPQSTVRWRSNNNRNIITGARMDGDAE